MKTACVAVVSAVLAATSWAGPKWDITEDSWMKLSILGQVHGSYLEDATPETDLYLRRARLILAGQVQDGVQFFVETDNANAGKSGASASTEIQDAFLDVRLLQSEHWVKAGLILLPFSFENRSSAGSLLGLDYNSEAIKLVNSFVWRDYGAELHGAFGDKVAYAAGVFDGYDSTTGTKNPDADLRMTGHVAVNLIGTVETAWFYNQDRRGKAPYVSVGAGLDSQGKATALVDETGVAAPTVHDSDAWVVDFQSGMAAGASTITLNGAYYDWDSSVFKGSTAFVETGVAIGKPMATFKYSIQDPDEGSETQDFTAGLHYYLKDHSTRAGIEYRWGDSADWWLVGLQFML